VGLNRDLDGNLVADDEVPFFQCSFEVDPEVTTVDLADTSKPVTLTLGSCSDRCPGTRFEGHGLGDALTVRFGEEFVLVAALRADLGRLEVERGEMLLVKEIRTLDVTVAHLVGGRDALGLDLGDDRGRLEGVAM